MSTLQKRKIDIKCDSPTIPGGNSSQENKPLCPSLSTLFPSSPHLHSHPHSHLPIQLPNNLRHLILHKRSVYVATAWDCLGGEVNPKRIREGRLRFCLFHWPVTCGSGKGWLKSYELIRSKRNIPLDPILNTTAFPPTLVIASRELKEGLHGCWRRIRAAGFVYVVRV